MGLMAKLVQRVAPIAAKFGGFVPGVGPLIQKAGVLLGKVPLKKAGAVIAAGGAFGAAEGLGGRMTGGGGGGGVMVPSRGGYFHPHRGYTVGERQHWHSGRKKRRAGLSGRDILGAQKVARLVQHFGYRPKIKPRKRRR